MAPPVRDVGRTLRLAPFEELRLARCLAHHGLAGACSWFAAHNAAASLPYHNNYHGLRVTMNCVDALAVEPLPEADTRVLLLAALFHDGDHSGGVLPDGDNIRAALALLDKAVGAGVVDAALQGGVAELIEATAHPYVRPAQTVSERILRDADLVNCLGEAWFEHLFLGLRRELEHQKGTLTLRAFCAMQEPFWARMELSSAWGRAYQAAYLQQARRRLATALEVCDFAQQHQLDELAAFKAVTAR